MIVKVISLLPQILVLVLLVVVVGGGGVVEVVIVVIVEVAMIRAEVDGWMDGWMDGMLGKCCLFGVSDLFLTFPGVFFNFKKSARAVKLGTILVIVKVISLLVPQILVLVLLVVGGGGGVEVVIVVIVIVEVAMIRAEVDGWMDGMLGKCCLFGVSDLFLTSF